MRVCVGLVRPAARRGSGNLGEGMLAKNDSAREKSRPKRPTMVGGPVAAAPAAGGGAAAILLILCLPCAGSSQYVWGGQGRRRIQASCFCVCRVRASVKRCVGLGRSMQRSRVNLATGTSKVGERVCAAAKPEAQCPLTQAPTDTLHAPHIHTHIHNTVARSSSASSDSEFNPANLPIRRGAHQSTDYRAVADDISTTDEQTEGSVQARVKPEPAMTPSSAAAPLQLYRSILRAARGMPTPRRRAFVVQKARLEFEAARHERDPEKVAFALSYGELQLETIRIQAQSLSALHCDPLYHNKREI